MRLRWCLCAGFVLLAFTSLTLTLIPWMQNPDDNTPGEVQIRRRVGVRRVFKGADYRRPITPGEHRTNHRVDLEGATFEYYRPKTPGGFPLRSTFKQGAGNSPRDLQRVNFRSASEGADTLHPTITRPPTMVSNADPGCTDLPPQFASPDRRLTRHNPPVAASCKLLSRGDEEERKRVREQMYSWNNTFSDREFMENLASNCTKTRQAFSNFYTSRVEREFPLAYIFLVHYKEGLIQQLVRLMKFFYRPHNAYCIHIDNKAPSWWKSLVRNLTSCLPNVIVPSQSVYIVYATTRILHAHLCCFRELVKSKIPWQYAFNLHSTELPLATNRDLVELTKSMDGINIVHIGENMSNTEISPSAQNKITHRVTWDNKGKLIYKRRHRLKPPFHLNLFKSAASANSALTRRFVNFMLSDRRAKFLARYLKTFPSAVEFFFSTVNNFPDAPGGRRQLTGRTMPLIVKRIWSHETANSSLCKEKHVVHKICICSASDLPWIIEAMEERKFYFLNKYLIGYDHVVMDCIEDRLVQRNVEEYTRDCTR